MSEVYWYTFYLDVRKSNQMCTTDNDVQLKRGDVLEVSVTDGAGASPGANIRWHVAITITCERIVHLKGHMWKEGRVLYGPDHQPERARWQRLKPKTIKPYLSTISVSNLSWFQNRM